MREAKDSLTWSTDQSTYAASGDLSNAALYSAPVSLDRLGSYAIQLVTTGATVTGAFKLQASNSDPNIPPDTGRPNASAMDWTEISSSSTTVIAAGSVMWNASDVGYAWVRVVWTESGTAAGSVTGRIKAKGHD